MYIPPMHEVVFRIRNRLSGGQPIPRPRYITNVCGAPDVRHFLTSGADTHRAITELLARNGIEPSTLKDVLDFGCGCGRVLRHWNRAGRLRLRGSDYNPHLVEWCRRNYKYGEFHLNQLAGRLPQPDASFDLVYAWSVFTHLTEEEAEHWVDELGRVLRPTGVLVATFHGEFYVPWLSPAELERFRAGDVIVHRGPQSGTNTCAAFHAAAAVRRLFEPRFDIVDSRAGVPPFREQDQYLLRRR
jgi:SAM-dependent methyltransferase